MKRWRAYNSLFASLRAIFHKHESPQELEFVPPFSKSELAERVRQSLESLETDDYPVLTPEGYNPKDGDPHSVFFDADVWHTIRISVDSQGAIFTGNGVFRISS